METTSKNIFLILAFLVVLFKGVVSSPTRYTSNDGNEYLIEADLKYNWLQASDECARRDLQLVIIDSAAKNAAFDVLLRQIFAKSPNLWIGYHDEFSTARDTNRPFYAISTGQQMSFNNWNNGEPNNGNSNEHCTHVYSVSDYKWNDGECHNTYIGYVCEKHYLSSKFVGDMEEKRRTANVLNTNLLTDFKTKEIEIEQIVKSTRSSTDMILEEFNNSANEIMVNSRSAIADIVRKKPYMEAVISDVGESLEEIIREALKEISGISQEAQQAIENIHLSAEESISENSSDFEGKLENNKNAIDKLLV